MFQVLNEICVYDSMKKKNMCTYVKYTTFDFLVKGMLDTKHDHK